MWTMTPGTVWLIVATVAWLVFLEGLLSADNALVLAMMVRHLPKREQKRALRYGIWGAFAFRVVAVLLAKVLLDFWFLKVLGGLYLLYLAFSHVVSRSEGDEEGAAKRFGSGFWGTVISVEIADIAFSIDSILAAVAMAEGLPKYVSDTTRFWVVITGGILGIITMRFVAGYFILLLERFRGLESGAYGLVAWIGLKLIIGGLHDPEIVPFEMNEWVFWPGMLVIVILSFLYQPKDRPPPAPEDSAVIEEMARIASGGDESEEA
jgi:YkoY family integral membrane protein